MKNLILLLIIGFAGYQAYLKLSIPAKTGIPAYSETRLEFQFGPRDVELVSFTKRDSSEPCEAVKYWLANTVIGCDVSNNCSIKELSCRDQIPERYEDMFEGYEASTTYFRAFHATSGREAIVLNWGLTQNEAREICKVIKSNVANQSAKNGENVTMECI